MDQKSLHVPFLTGSMTSSCVASASNPADPVIGTKTLAVLHVPNVS